MALYIFNFWCVCSRPVHTAAVELWSLLTRGSTETNCLLFERLQLVFGLIMNRHIALVFLRSSQLIAYQTHYSNQKHFLVIFLALINWTLLLYSKSTGNEQCVTFILPMSHCLNQWCIDVCSYIPADHFYLQAGSNFHRFEPRLCPIHCMVWFIAGIVALVTLFSGKVYFI